jgi:hypothetical protein
MSVPNRGPELQAVCYTLAVSSVIAVALRIYVRVRMVKNFGLDDWFMCSALVSRSPQRHPNITTMHQLIRLSILDI